jgi:hypothetical protein
MASETQAAPVSKGKLWTGRILSALFVVFMLFNGAMSLTKPPFAVQGFVRMGYAERLMVPIGILMIACTILYAIPRTSVLGALFLTAYFGGATATHVRMGESPALAIIVCVVAWIGLFLREERLLALVPLRR